MTTSANVIEYTIYSGEKVVGHFRKNVLCRLPDYAELLKYQPLWEHEILAWGYDEEEDEWYDEPESLEKFLKQMMPTNKKIRAYFNGEKTVEQIMQEFEEERKEEVRKMHEHFAEQKKKILEELKNK